MHVHIHYTSNHPEPCSLSEKVLGMKKSNMIKTMIAAFNSNTHALY